MADPDEVVQEFSSMTEAECQVAEQYKEEIMRAGASHVYVQRRDNHPNRIEIWASTHDAAEAASDVYVNLCKEHIEE